MQSPELLEYSPIGPRRNPGVGYVVLMAVSAIFSAANIWWLRASLSDDGWAHVAVIFYLAPLTLLADLIFSLTPNVMYLARANVNRKAKVILLIGTVLNPVLSIAVVVLAVIVPSHGS